MIIIIIIILIAITITINNYNNYNNNIKIYRAPFPNGSMPLYKKLNL